MSSFLDDHNDVLRKVRSGELTAKEALRLPLYEVRGSKGCFDHVDYRNNESCPNCRSMRREADRKNRVYDAEKELQRAEREVAAKTASAPKPATPSALRVKAKAEGPGAGPDENSSGLGALIAVVMIFGLPAIVVGLLARVLVHWAAGRLHAISTPILLIGLALIALAYVFGALAKQADTTSDSLALLGGTLATGLGVAALLSGHDTNVVLTVVIYVVAIGGCYIAGTHLLPLSNRLDRHEVKAVREGRAARMSSKRRIEPTGNPALDDPDNYEFFPVGMTTTATHYVTQEDDPEQYERERIAYLRAWQARLDEGKDEVGLRLNHQKCRPDGCDGYLDERCPVVATGITLADWVN